MHGKFYGTVPGLAEYCWLLHSLFVSPFHIKIIFLGCMSFQQAQLLAAAVGGLGRALQQLPRLACPETVAVACSGSRSSQNFNLFSHWSSVGSSDAPSSSYSIPSDYDDASVYKQTIPQRRFASRFETAVQMAFHSDAVLRAHLIEKHGLAIDRLRISTDRKTASILWSCIPGREEQCKRDLGTNAFRIRRCVSSNLQAKHSPYLEFHFNRLPPQRASVMQALDTAQREEGGAEAELKSSDKVDAAIARLQDDLMVR